MATRVRGIGTDGHKIAQQQIAQHGKDRYPTTEKQLKKVAEELAELALAIGHAEGQHGQPGLDPEVRHEYADVGLAFFELGNKLGLDLIACMAELAGNDTRRFD